MTPVGMETLGTGQSVFLVIVGALALLSGLAVALSRKAVHAAVYMMSMMVCVSGIYFSLGAEFLGAVQIVVYTGAIMMLFLFVIMMVGVQAVDSPRESKITTVVSAVVLVVAFSILAVAAAAQTDIIAYGSQPTAESNPAQIATSLISSYYVPMEMVAGLLIIAAVSAMTLTHSDALLPRLTQPFVVSKRMEAYKNDKHILGQQVPPGVYAETNALDVPAINGETGAQQEDSVPRVVRVNGENRTLGEVSPWTARALARQNSGEVGLHGSAATRQVARSQAWGMSGGDTSALDFALESSVNGEEKSADASLEGTEKTGSEHVSTTEGNQA